MLIASLRCNVRVCVSPISPAWVHWTDIGSGADKSTDGLAQTPARLILSCTFHIFAPQSLIDILTFPSSVKIYTEQFYSTWSSSTAMRLINTRTLELLELFGDKIPEEYAILSHTWEDEEVTLQDWKDLRVAEKKRGFYKISMACKQAQLHNLDYLWADTACIDKTSSAELSEAINSMFSWYQDATICYVYLADVKPMPVEWDTMTEPYIQHFCRSRWFNRGWTLQELLAPTALTFYSQDWSKIASRSTLAQVISETTQINREYLRDIEKIKEANIAQKMSWLSRRVTTRVEDMAYCMLGIFNVNMPLLYGEGSKAFTRLQEEIIKTSNDHTIFCWNWTDQVPRDWCSLLAPFPEAFKHATNFVSAEPTIANKLTFKMTNAGLSITLPVIQTWTYYLGVLNVRDGAYPYGPGLESYACVPIEGSSSDGVLERRVMRRIKFPSAPVFVQSRWILCRPHLYIQSNSFAIHSTPAASFDTRWARSPYTFLLAFDDTKQLLGSWAETLGSTSCDGIFLTERTRDFVPVETFPPNAFDRYRSLVTVDSTSSTPGVLIRLGNSEKYHVLYLGVSYVDDEPIGKPTRFGGIVSKSDLSANPFGPELLEALLSDASLHKKWREGRIRDSGFKSGIGFAIGADAAGICVAYITCDSGRMKKLRWRAPTFDK